MSKFAQLLVIGLIACVASAASRADGCKYSAKREGAIDTAGAKRVQISTRAGSLALEGKSGATRVEASGLACASSEQFLEQIRIETKREGEVLYLDVRMPNLEGEPHEDDDRYATLDIRISVPDTLAVVATDSSGEARIRDLAALDMTDSSGELRISDIAGDVKVRDSSGDIAIRDVGGGVVLNDSSGNVVIDQVAKDVNVEVDSSGDLEIREVKGSVHIEQDSSGDIRVGDVTGGVEIESDSSGSVDVWRVGGAFNLGTKGSGDVQFADIKGPVSVPKR